jgi:transcription antitermination factor NusG
MLKLNDNPVCRYPEGRSLDDDLGRWTVAYVKSRQEKALASDLARRGVPYFLPMTEKRVRRRDNGKIRKSVIPLFPGYVSIALPGSEWNLAYGTHRVVRLIPVEEQAAFVRELRQVERLLEARAMIEPAPAFSPGQPVRVHSGPMMGLEGEVVRQQGETLFIIRVHLFQQAVKVELDEAYLEPLTR